MPLVLGMYLGSRENCLDWKVSVFQPHFHRMMAHREQVRGIGTSLSTATNWAANLLIGSTYLSLMDKITPAGAFGFYAGLCLLGWIFVLTCFPETAGLSLEEVKMVFRNGFGIRESQRLIEAKKNIQKRDSGKQLTVNGGNHLNGNVEKSWYIMITLAMQHFVALSVHVTGVAYGLLWRLTFLAFGCCRPILFTNSIYQFPPLCKTRSKNVKYGS